MNAWSKAGECNGALEPTVSPSASPTGSPSLEPSSEPSLLPSSGPSSEPSSQPSSEPSLQPSSESSSKPSSQPSESPSSQPAYFEYIGVGYCTDANNVMYSAIYKLNMAESGIEQSCQDACPVTDEFRGISFTLSGTYRTCYCWYDGGSLPSTPQGYNEYTQGVGSGPVTSTNTNVSENCYKYHPAQ